jgi:hypothetical protein
MKVITAKAAAIANGAALMATHDIPDEKRNKRNDHQT